jgi:hypothetical protein
LFSSRALIDNGNEEVKASPKDREQPQALPKLIRNDEETKVAYSAPKVDTELADDEQNLITIEVYG